MIVECNVWCVGNPEKLIELGLEEGDSWMPFAIDFNIVESIKLAGENEFLGNDKATLYYNGNHTTVDISFTEAIKIWRKAKNE